MRIVAQKLAGVFLLTAQPQRDTRGYFARVFDAAALHTAGLETHFPERGIAANDRAGTIRGLHFSAAPHEETKIVTCVRGCLYDVVLDMRPDSATFGQWDAFELDANRFDSLYVPRGFAHGYQTLTDTTHVAYDISTPYVAAAARGVRYNDPVLAIPWPQAVTVISPRDAALDFFANVTTPERFHG